MQIVTLFTDLSPTSHNFISLASKFWNVAPMWFADHTAEDSDLHILRRENFNSHS